jgi:hypothetical protein
MAVRKRFNAAERAILTSGQPIQWQNVTQWHAARITDSTIVTVDGWQHVMGVNLATTRTCRSGEVIELTPGHIRLAP